MFTHQHPNGEDETNNAFFTHFLSIYNRYFGAYTLIFIFRLHIIPLGPTLEWNELLTSDSVPAIMHHSLQSCLLNDSEFSPLQKESNEKEDHESRRDINIQVTLFFCQISFVPFPILAKTKIS